ncbi:MAG: SAM-dependent chlorinase/fluorinase [Myxococcota bacterium]|nr:SAM-dependent chlorinase/fluorinase [Myxococcota bacterium]
MTKPSGIITLLTDFGLSDPFVGIMHGVLLSKKRDFTLIDLTHGIEPQNVRQAAFWIASSYREFPEGTVHMVVVDPGVGSKRRPLIAEIDGHYFVAPDNGVLSLVVDEAERVDVRYLRLWQLELSRVSNTFHGRDIFSPAAAELAIGKRWMTELGEDAIETYKRLDVQSPSENDGRISGQIFMSDHFGNWFTNIPLKMYESWASPRVRIGELELPLQKTYSEVAPGDVVALTNSFDRLEIAVNQGSARKELPFSVGQAVEIIE